MGPWVIPWGLWVSCRAPTGGVEGAVGGPTGRGQWGSLVCGDPHGTTELPRRPVRSPRGSVRVPRRPPLRAPPASRWRSAARREQTRGAGLRGRKRGVTWPHPEAAGLGPAAMSGGAEVAAAAGAEAERRVRIVVEYW